MTLDSHEAHLRQEGTEILLLSQQQKHLLQVQVCPLRGRTPVTSPEMRNRVCCSPVSGQERDPSTNCAHWKSRVSSLLFQTA